MENYRRLMMAFGEFKPIIDTSNKCTIKDVGAILRFYEDILNERFFLAGEKSSPQCVRVAFSFSQWITGRSLRNQIINLLAHARKVRVYVNPSPSGRRVPDIGQYKSKAITRPPLVMRKVVVWQNDLDVNPRSLRHLKLLLRYCNALASEIGEPRGDASIADYNAEPEQTKYKGAHFKGVVFTTLGFVLGVIGLWQGILRRRIAIGSALIVVSTLLCFVGPFVFFGLI